MKYLITQLYDGYCEIITLRRENRELTPVNKYIVGECDKAFQNGRQRTLFNILTDCRYLDCWIQNPYKILRDNAYGISSTYVKINNKVNILDNLDTDVQLWKYASSQE